jgi:hypothetical protein
MEFFLPMIKDHYSTNAAEIQLVNWSASRSSAGLDNPIGYGENALRGEDDLLCVFADRRSLKEEYFRVEQSISSPKLVVFGARSPL